MKQLAQAMKALDIEALFRKGHNIFEDWHIGKPKHTVPSDENELLAAYYDFQQAKAKEEMKPLGERNKWFVHFCDTKMAQIKATLY